MAMLPDGGTTWPWESMHVEALAWFDHYLKGRDTGVTDGSREYLCLGTGLARPPRAHKSDPPSVLYWQSAPLEADPDARRFAAGHRIQLMITSDDQAKDVPVFLGYRHSPVGTTARNTIHASSRLVVPVLPR